MEQAVLTALVTQVITIVGAVVASGWITNAVVELLKLNTFKKLGKKYPVPVSIITSIVVSAAAIFTLNLVLLTTWLSYVVFAAGTLFVATISYDGILKKIKESSNDPVEQNLHDDVY